jgi:hypothetical protein
VPVEPVLQALDRGEVLRLQGEAVEQRDERAGRRRVEGDAHRGAAVHEAGRRPRRRFT